MSLGIFLYVSHLADLDRPRSIIISMVFCFLWPELVLFDVAQILISDYLYNQYRNFDPSMIAKHMYNT